MEKISSKYATVRDDDHRIIVKIYNDRPLYEHDYRFVQLEDCVFTLEDSGVLQIEGGKIRYYNNCRYIYGEPNERPKTMAELYAYAQEKGEEFVINDEHILQDNSKFSFWDRLFTKWKYPCYSEKHIEFVRRKPYKRFCSNYQLILDDQIIER